MINEMYINLLSKNFDIESEYFKKMINLLSNESNTQNYIEKHHILPKSLYNEYVNDKNNIISLSAYEHITVHECLFMCAKNKFVKYKMGNAYFNMMNYSEYRLSNMTIEEIECIKQNYATLKENFSKLKSEKFSGKNNPMYGKCGKLNPNYDNHALSGKNNPMYNKNPRDYMSEETKILHDKRISESLKGKRTGKNNPMYGKCGKLNPNYGKNPYENLTEEQYENMKYKKSLARKGKHNSLSKLIYCVELNKSQYWLDWVNELGISGSNLSHCLKTTHYSHGYHFYYKDDLEK